MTRNNNDNDDDNYGDDDDNSNKVSRLNKILNCKYQKPISPISKWEDFRISVISMSLELCGYRTPYVSRPNKILNCRYQKPISSK